MKILHFMPQYPGKDGTSAFCSGLCPALNRIEADSSWVASVRNDRRPVPKGMGVLWYPKGRSRNPFHVPAELLSDLRERKHGFDGVILHGNYNPRAAILGRKLKEMGIPYIFMPHDPYVKELRNHHRWRKILYWHLFEKKLIAGAREIQLLDDRHARPLRELGCQGPTFVIPNGCDPAMSDDLPAETRIPGSGDEIRFLFLGRMDRNQKGLDLLIRGFARFVKNRRDPDPVCRLILTGNDWEDRGFLEKLATAEGVAGATTFTGRRPEPSVAIAAEADVAVLTSRFEGFGLGIVESMLAARPVLVSEVAGVAPHVLAAAGGWTVEPTVEAIAAAFPKVLEQRDRWAGMGTNNREYVLRHLTWDQVAEVSAAHYERIFGNS